MNEDEQSALLDILHEMATKLDQLSCKITVLEQEQVITQARVDGILEDAVDAVSDDDNCSFDNDSLSLEDHHVLLNAPKFPADILKALAPVQGALPDEPE